MSDKTLKDLKYEAHIAVLNTKVESLIEKQKELTQRVRANEKVVAAIGLLGSIALAFIGAGYFAAPADAFEIERLEEKQEELRERLKVVEKWVIGAAAVLAAGTTVIGFATNISKAYL